MLYIKVNFKFQKFFYEKKNMEEEIIWIRIRFRKRDVMYILWLYWNVIGEEYKYLLKVKLIVLVIQGKYQEKISF